MLLIVVSHPFRTKRGKDGGTPAEGGLLYPEATTKTAPSSSLGPPYDRTRQPAATCLSPAGLDRPLAAGGPAHPGAAGLCDGGALSVRAVAAPAPAGRRGLEPGAGPARPVAARLCLRIREEEPRADGDRPLRLHPQPALPGVHADGSRVCVGAEELAGGAGAGGGVLGDLQIGRAH